MKKKLILIGGGGHCKACIDVISATGEWDILGIIDVKEKIGEKILGYSIIGTDEEINDWIKRDVYFMLTIGQLKSSLNRVRLFNQIVELGGRFPVIISPNARVANTASLGDGTIVMHGAMIGPEVVVGQNCIINTGATIEHESEIGAHCHISTSSTINGQCKVGSRSLIGSGAVLKNNVGLAEEVVIGAGSVVINDINMSGVYVGVPANRINYE